MVRFGQGSGQDWNRTETRDGPKTLRLVITHGVKTIVLRVDSKRKIGSRTELLDD